MFCSGYDTVLKLPVQPHEGGIIPSHLHRQFPVFMGFIMKEGTDVAEGSPPGLLDLNDIRTEIS